MISEAHSECHGKLIKTFNKSTCGALADILAIVSSSSFSFNQSPF